MNDQPQFRQQFCFPRALLSAAVALLLATAATARAADPVADSADIPAPVEPLAPAKKASVADGPANGRLAWAEGLAVGRKLAAQTGRPLLVRVGAPWCGWCTKLRDEMETTNVEQELRRWTLAYVDSDDAPTDASQLGVGPIPALRVLNAAGKLVAEQDGYLPAEPLLAWLKSAYDDASAAAPEMLVATGPPTPDDVAKLIEGFADSNVSRREAAMRRLLPHRAAAAAGVAAVLEHKKLAVQLAALELLSEWRAPVEGLDPWRPETLTRERLKAIADWAATSGDAAAESAELSPEQLAEAREQLGRMIAASDDDADAIVERLARFGPRLSPLVSTLLKEATTDRRREQLLALRYRLVATDALALNWPTGLKRLAAVEVRIRRQAAEELVARATAADEPLLSEVFSDPDALVREISLRGLQAVGGDKAGGTLVRLLADPDPNVRAAVLKQLSEDPSTDYVKRVADYALKEPDADLVLHAVRYLKEAGSPTAVPPLIKLLEHPSWQVRAEAAEALTKKSGRHSSSPADQAQAVDIYTALIVRLSDEDAFVVSRAAEGLRNSNLVAAAKPLAAAAEKHPELATEIIAALVQSDPMRTATQAMLRKFAEHADPRVRAGAIAGLVAANEDSEGELAVAGLNDVDSTVRREVADSIFKLCQQQLEQRNQNQQANVYQGQQRSSVFGTIFSSIFGGGAKPAAKNAAKADDAEDRAVNPADAWLIAFHRGKGRPKWMLKTVEPLQKMLGADKTLGAEKAQEQLAAALPLTALGKEEQTLPVLLGLVGAEGIPREAVAPALPWLRWPGREALFNRAVEMGGHQIGHEFCENLAASRDPRVADLLWKLLAGKDVTVQLASSVYGALKELSPSNESDPFAEAAVEVGPEAGPNEPAPAPVEPTDEPAPAKADAAKEDAAKDAAAKDAAAKDDATAKDDAGSPRAGWLTYASKGTPWQRIIALALLIHDRDTVRRLATEMLDDPRTEDEFRADALQLLLLSLGPKQGEKLAVERLASSNPRIAKGALMYLVRGPESIQVLREAIYINASINYGGFSGGVAIEVESPAGLKEDDARKLLASNDAEVVAGAGYLLATLQKSDGLDALIAQWRKDPSRREGWSRALYRAITAVDDDSRTPILREINAVLDSWSKREFYWTIRSMHGTEILKLRKEIRDTVGMEQLR